MEEAEVVLCYHVSAVHTDTCHLEGYPYGVTGEQLVVGRNTRELDHTELENEVVDKLLSLFLCQGALLEVALNIDIQEGRDSADAHSCAVLCLDRGEVAEVEPLNGFLSVFGRRGDIEAVDLSHLLHALESADLLGDLLSEADMLLGSRINPSPL